MARKALADLEQSAKKVRLDEVVSGPPGQRFSIRGGTKHGYTAQRGEQTMTIPRQRAVVLPVYVKQAVDRGRREEASGGDDEEG